MLNKAMLQLQKRRWQEVVDFEIKEERQTSTLKRWQKLNALFRIAVGLELQFGDSLHREKVVGDRWNKLRNLHHNKVNS